MTNINKELSHSQFSLREYSVKHLSFEKEMEFYECVRSGNTEQIKELMLPLGGDGFGILSDDSLRNLKYHLIISIAMITRFCTEGGMEMENAFDMSDIYIMKTDKCTTVSEVHEIHRDMIMDFTKRMKTIVQGDCYSKQIKMCIDYIYDNLHKRLKLSDVANYLSLSPQYLSKIFHSEVGITLNEYIKRKKIESAKNMLLFSEYSSVDICNYLCFSSQSHFIDNFKKYTGLTPKEYRIRYYRKINVR